MTKSQEREQLVAAKAAFSGDVAKLPPEPYRHRNTTRFSFSPQATIQAIGLMMVHERNGLRLHLALKKGGMANIEAKRKLAHYVKGKRLINEANRLLQKTTI